MAVWLDCHKNQFHIETKMFGLCVSFFCRQLLYTVMLYHTKNLADVVTVPYTVFLYNIVSNCIGLQMKLFIQTKVTG